MPRRPPGVREAFTDRLRVAIERRKITQTSLADACGVTQSTVSDWLNKHAMPNSEVLVALATVLNVSADWLLFGSYGRSGTPPVAQTYLDGGARRHRRDATRGGRD